MSDLNPPAAPPSSPVLAAVPCPNPQEKSTQQSQGSSSSATSAPIPIARPATSNHNNAIGADIIDAFETPLRTMMPPMATPTRYPSGAPLIGHYGLSSCSQKTYIPTPFNSPFASPIGSPVKASTLLRLRGGGPKKRRGGITSKGGQRKKPGRRASRFDDVEILLSDPKSPIFKEDANIKGLVLHEKTKEIMKEDGAEYAFEHMAREEVATTAAEFKEDGAYGRLDAEWLRQAMEASKERANGDYDDFLEAQFKEIWEDEGGEELSDDEN